MSISRSQRARRSRSLTVVLTAMLCGGVSAGAYGYMSPKDSNPLAAQVHNTKAPAEPEVPTFTDADTGSCVNWTPGKDGLNTGFTSVECAQPHRFEVSAREDLSKYPTSEFGKDAQRPGLERQQQLTAELCNGPTLAYLKGKLDPEGRYQISPILPPASYWEKGDRTMLCGVMVPDANGRSVETVGLAAETDQARAYPADTCVRVDNNVPVQVPCNQDHTWQVTDVVNLASAFPDAWPNDDKQNEFLNKRCTEAAQKYLGSDDNLYYSTLTPFWTTIHAQSWEAGSRTVNCALTFGREGGGFAVLNGDVRQGFTIDGKQPVTPPKRNPLRSEANNQAPTDSGAGTNNSGTSPAQGQ
ncbi:septum formation family protein [Corynebacterium anserum]|uniref:Septum formation-related domain-containing protein n=1 Tax=Corynebacterium anserum TaxID=2684406 RepID=A0A7G7YLL6_9CORY|nr:septum formation family protein [Corynebacterium anserum]MBC2681456.1 hypothetical protein [Corynebacterium anserum]QNH95386.1 hypothetical protein GP473_00550 [Corynebacterium anserum]